MAGWVLMPRKSGVIREFIPYKPRGKIIGRFSHCKVDKKGSLVGLKVKDGPEMKITRETITAEGHEPWLAVTYMDTNENRRECAEWVWQLITEGKH